MAKKTLAPQASQAMAPPNIKVGTNPPLRGTPRPRAGKGGYDPSMGTAKSVRNVQERMGSQLRINVALPGPQSPEAKATQANGKVLPSVMGAKNNFFGAQGDAYR